MNVCFHVSRGYFVIIQGVSRRIPIGRLWGSVYDVTLKFYSMDMLNTRHSTPYRMEQYR